MIFRPEILVKLREQRHMTQQDLAKACGVDVTTISRVELGRVKPRKTTMRKIADALNFSESAFYSFDESNKNIDEGRFVASGTNDSFPIVMTFTEEQFKEIQEAAIACDLPVEAIVMNSLHKSLSENREELQSKANAVAATHGIESPISYEERLSALESELSKLVKEKPLKRQPEDK